MANTGKGNKPGIRRVGRTLAFQVLYGLPFSHDAGSRQLNDAFDKNPLVIQQESKAARDFALELVLGVHRELATVDPIIESNSQHWKLDRIARVELAILRLSLYEILYTDIPLKAAINEGIELAKTFGDGNSRGFVNGILDAVSRDVCDGKFNVTKSF